MPSCISGVQTIVDRSDLKHETGHQEADSACRSRAVHATGAFPKKSLSMSQEGQGGRDTQRIQDLPAAWPRAAIGDCRRGLWHGP